MLHLTGRLLEAMVHADAVKTSSKVDELKYQEEVKIGQLLPNPKPNNTQHS